jgi:Rod binding domain-containing protein
VAQTFFGTLIKQMRNSPFKSPLFDGGRGGQAFGELYDQRMVDHMSRGVGNKLVGALVRSIVDAQKKKDDTARAGAAAKAGAAYARHSKLGPRAVSAPGSHAGADLNGRADARPFPQKRRAPARPDIISIRK